MVITIVATLAVCDSLKKWLEDAGAGSGVSATQA